MITLIKKLVPDQYKIFRHARFGTLGWHLVNSDRRMLQDKIIPFFSARDDVKTVLDVGVEWYNANYHRCFPKANYYTIDIAPEMAKHGREGFHHVMSVTDLELAFAENSLDLILSNGPFGWGVNLREDIMKTMDQYRRALRPGGFMVVGWNALEGHTPEVLPSAAAAAVGFEPFELPTLKTTALLANEKTAHHFEFYRLSK